jgi:hypothetical protein
MAAIDIKNQGIPFFRVHMENMVCKTLVGAPPDFSIKICNSKHKQ